MRLDLALYNLASEDEIALQPLRWHCIAVAS